MATSHLQVNHATHSFPRSSAAPTGHTVHVPEASRSGVAKAATMLPMKPLLLIFSLCFPVLADVAAGLQALKSGDYALAAKEFLVDATQGNAVAQYNLGILYHEGHGVPRDFNEAVRWFRLAAEQGAAPGASDAQFLLAWSYEEGAGVPKDYKEAARWYRQAADHGQPFAQTNLGLAYVNGRGVERDPAEAAELLRKAASRNYPPSLFSLGELYERGFGVPQDYVQAHMWFNLAASRGDGNGAKYRDTVAGKMPPADVAEAQRLARDWRPGSSAWTNTPEEKLRVNAASFAREYVRSHVNAPSLKDAAGWSRRAIAFSNESLCTVQGPPDFEEAKGTGSTPPCTAPTKIGDGSNKDSIVYRGTVDYRDAAGALLRTKFQLHIFSKDGQWSVTDDAESVNLLYTACLALNQSLLGLAAADRPTPVKNCKTEYPNGREVH